MSPNTVFIRFFQASRRRKEIYDYFPDKAAVGLIPVSASAQEKYGQPAFFCADHFRLIPLLAPGIFAFSGQFYLQLASMR
jgi:hypothetical protein